MTLNEKTVTAKLKRIDLCDLMLACTCVSENLKDAGQPAEKWDALHDKIRAIIDDFDAKQVI